MRELAEPGSMAPDQERRIKTLIAGSVEIDYELGVPQATNFTVIEGILAPLLGAKPGTTISSFVARALCRRIKPSPSTGLAGWP